MESYLAEMRVPLLEEESVTPWISTFSDTVGRWGSWLSGAGSPAPAPVAPQLEMQSFSQGIHELPDSDVRTLQADPDEEEAPWGDDSELPGELEEGDLEGLGIMDLEAPPPPFGSDAYAEHLKAKEMLLRQEMGAEMGEIQMVDLGPSGISNVESGLTARIMGKPVGRLRARPFSCGGGA